jgi:hypothetical protein
LPRGGDVPEAAAVFVIAALLVAALATLLPMDF